MRKALDIILGIILIAFVLFLFYDTAFQHGRFALTLLDVFLAAVRKVSLWLAQTAQMLN